LDFRHRERSQRLQAPHGQAHGARMDQWNDTDDEQTGDEEADRNEHDRFDHGLRLLKPRQLITAATDFLPQWHGRPDAASVAGGYPNPVRAGRAGAGASGARQSQPPVRRCSLFACIQNGFQVAVGVNLRYPTLAPSRMPTPVRIGTTTTLPAAS